MQQFKEGFHLSVLDLFVLLLVTFVKDHEKIPSILALFFFIISHLNCSCLISLLADGRSIMDSGEEKGIGHYDKKNEIDPLKAPCLHNGHCSFSQQCKNYVCMKKELCKEGEVQKCQSGFFTNSKKGLCIEGKQRCDNDGIWGKCKGEIKPQIETCGDKKDNNCNGLVDEGCCKKWRFSHQLNEHPELIAISSKTDVLASAKPNGIISLWDYKLNKKLMSIRIRKIPEGGLESLILHPKHKYVIISALREIFTWNILQTKIHAIKKPHGEDFSQAIAFNSTGELFASVSSLEIKIYWTKSGALFKKIPMLQVNRVTDMKFHPNGRHIVTSSGEDMSVSIWNIQTGSRVVKLSTSYHKIESTSLDFSGKLLLTGSINRSLVLWDLVSFKKIYKITSAHEYPITKVSLSPNGQFIASGGEDYYLKIWNAKTEELLQKFKLTGSPTDVFFSPNGKYIIVNPGTSFIKIWTCE